MKIYALNPPYKPGFVRSVRGRGGISRGGTLYYPVWLAYAAGVLERTWEVRLVDAPAWRWGVREVIRDAVNYRPDMVIVDSNFSSLENDIDVARLLKKSTDARVALVGPPASRFAEYILSGGGVDIVARYEYDRSLVGVAAALAGRRSLQGVEGVSFKEGRQIRHNPDRDLTMAEDLDLLPFVSKVYKRHLNVKDYFLSSSLYPEVQIITSRGCPNRCTFCSWPETLTGRKYRARSIAGVIEELQYIKKELPAVREVVLEDDTFTLNRERVVRFCEEILRKNFKVTWSCNARANLDYETMGLMKRAGCRLIIVGYESGCDQILQNIRKGISTGEMRTFTEKAKKAGLLIHGDFIIGLPGETPATAQKTMDFIRGLKPNILQVEVAMPIPGTEFYEWALRKGYLIFQGADDKLGCNAAVSYPQFSSKEIEESAARILFRYYFSPGYLRVALSNVLRKNGAAELRLMARAAGVFVRQIMGGSAGK